MKKVFFTIITLIAAFTAIAQYPRVDIPGSQVRKIYSSIVKQEYELHILLPGEYDGADKKYPVVYLMDSQWDFPLVKSLYGQHYYDGFIPELIIVGVTWGGLNPNPDSLRARDYTPTKEARLPQSGGADLFLSFMKNELFPFIEKNYKVNSANRTLMGCSLGGLITLYTLFTQPELFAGYAAASPAIGWDNGILYKYEKAFADKKLSNPVRVYMTVGDVEGGKSSFQKFASLMIKRNYPSVALQSKVLDNTGHSGTKSETFGRGLQYIFKRPQLTLSKALLKKYSGTYKTSNDNTVEIREENNSLVFYFSQGNKYELVAANETDFYSTAEFFNLYFKNETGKAAGFRLERYEYTRIFTKIN